YPSRIVCLTEETTETLYLLEEDWRIVGISGFTVRPPRARREKPKVSAFLSAKVERIRDLRPDLVLGFSDLQADIAAQLVRLGLNVFIFNQRDVAGILQMIRVLGGMIGCEAKAAALAVRLEQELDAVRARVLRGVGRADDLRHPLGLGADRHRRWRGLLRRQRPALARQGPHHRRPARSGAPLAGHHPRLLVRQEIPARYGCEAAGMGAGAGGSAAPAARDQVADHPAA